MKSTATLTYKASPLKITVTPAYAGVQTAHLPER
jgi:hypothetical protein